MATFRQFPNGRWQVVVRRKGYRPQLKTFPTRSDAKQWARLIESEIDRAVFVDRELTDRVTLGELINRYILEILPQKKSAASLKRCLTFLRPHFQHYTLATLKPQHVAAYRDSRIAIGRAGATVVKEINMLARVIDTAIAEWGFYIPVNPAKAIHRPVVAKGRERRLSAQEEIAIFKACQGSKSTMLASAVRIALETGMRLGEILSMRWDYLDLTKRTIYLPDTKNGDSRTVPLSSAAIASLATLPRHITDRRIFWKWSRPDSFEKAWRHAVTDSGIKDLRFHDLRHEAVSRLFERGFNLLEVSAISGHKTLQMLKRYTHLKAEELACKLG